ncbi:PQQ-binding-like beta-propeller repeat protein [Micromonospora fiedleri]|uniref:PQQ-binding-like beta-propeller repeat protein n=1 Tax=Micromonospora fiedleri TaxID=1157498 RepID=A0ABS1UE93_9ACTN|nr:MULTISPECIES: PQQ-binding-like beta-propeller repeat protein [Micromonospora]MBL6274661.1 PQQ-binding-like beta-propeller repeat protein [Micromonospora fiedleri]WSK44623.1 PQQ-binding-like beta-propeller repeat protein [Micromonospora maris]
MTLIDLGELSAPSDPQPPRRRPRRGTSRWPVALMALVVLVVLTAAAPPAARVHATVPAGLPADLFLTEEHIFTVNPAPRVTDGSQELTAYARPRRATVTPQPLAALWRVPVPPGHRFFRVESVADGVLFALVPSQSTGHPGETMLLDAATGQQRWRAVGFGTPDASGRVLLQTMALDESTTLRSVELATGRELWSRTMPPSLIELHQRDGVIDALVLSTNAGDVEVLDAATGRLRHRLPAVDTTGYQQVSVVDDLLVMVRNSRTVTAYDLAGLVPRWQATVPLADFVTRCGALLCARANRGGTHVLDPATGNVRWSTSEVVDLLWVTQERAIAQLDGHGLVTLDAATGEVVTEYGPWDTVASYERVPRLLGIRLVPETGAVLARLDPARSQPRRIDVLPDVTGGCQSRYDLIACRQQNGSFGLWQLPD